VGNPAGGRIVIGGAILVVLVSFALNSVITRYIVSRHLLDPGLATAVRFVAGTFALGILFAVQGRFPQLRPTRSNLVPAACLGAYALLISYGYAYITADAGTFVFYACVLLTMALAAYAATRERPRAVVALGALLAVGGVALLAAGHVAGTTPLGVVLLAGTGVSWGAYSHLGRGRPDALGFTARNFVTLACAIVPVAGAALLFVGSRLTISMEGVAYAAVMGAGTTALSYAVWYWVLRRITGAQAGTYQLAIPVLASALGVRLLDEPWTDTLGLAAALVLAGMALAAWPARSKPIGVQIAPEAAPDRPRP
jgi:drug/metabolite transporter (DMT)-like permease